MRLIAGQSAINKQFECSAVTGTSIAHTQPTSLVLQEQSRKGNRKSAKKRGSAVK